MQTCQNSMRILNICTGKAVSVTQVAETLYGIFQKPADLRFDPPKPGDIKHSLGSPDLANRKTGLSAQISLKQGLEIVASNYIR